MGDALAFARVGGARQRQAPGQGEQGAADEPGVQGEADPAGFGHRAFGEHEQAHDGGRREAAGRRSRRPTGWARRAAAPPRTSPRRRCRRRPWRRRRRRAATPGGSWSRSRSASPCAYRKQETAAIRAAPERPKSPMIRASSSEPQPRNAPVAYPAQISARTSWEHHARPAASLIGGRVRTAPGALTGRLPASGAGLGPRYRRPGPRTRGAAPSAVLLGRRSYVDARVAAAWRPLPGGRSTEVHCRAMRAAGFPQAAPPRRIVRPLAVHRPSPPSQ